MPDGSIASELAGRDELDAWNKAVRRRAIQNKISRELRSQYKLAKELPRGIFTLLMQLDSEQNGHHEGKGRA
jgi:hypothetical protein